MFDCKAGRHQAHWLFHTGSQATQQKPGFEGWLVSATVGRENNSQLSFSPRKKSYDQPRQCIKKQRYHFADKGPYSQSCGFSSIHVQMWDELDHKEGWVSKNWLFWIVMLEKTLESTLDSKEIKPVNPKRNQPWIFTGRTVAEAPILWPPHG